MERCWRRRGNERAFLCAEGPIFSVWRKAQTPPEALWERPGQVMERLRVQSIFYLRLLLQAVVIQKGIQKNHRSIGRFRKNYQLPRPFGGSEASSIKRVAFVSVAKRYLCQVCQKRRIAGIHDFFGRAREVPARRRGGPGGRRKFSPVWPRRLRPSKSLPLRPFGGCGSDLPITWPKSHQRTNVLWRSFAGKAKV